MLLRQGISNNYRQRSFTKDWLQLWKQLGSLSTWRAFVSPFAAALGACRSNAAESGALCHCAVASVPRLGSPSALLGTCLSPGRHSPCVHTTHLHASGTCLRGPCAEKTPGKYVGKALKNDVCNALQFCVTYVAHTMKAVGPEQSILAGPKNPDMIWAGVNYWIRSLVSMESHFTMPTPLTKQVH